MNFCQLGQSFDSVQDNYKEKSVVYETNTRNNLGTFQLIKLAEKLKIDVLDINKLRDKVNCSGTSIASSSNASSSYASTRFHSIDSQA